MFLAPGRLRPPPALTDLPQGSCSSRTPISSSLLSYQLFYSPLLFSKPLSTPLRSSHPHSFHFIFSPLLSFPFPFFSLIFSSPLFPLLLSFKLLPTPLHSFNPLSFHFISLYFLSSFPFPFPLRFPPLLSSVPPPFLTHLSQPSLSSALPSGISLPSFFYLVVYDFPIIHVLFFSSLSCH